MSEGRSVAAGAAQRVGSGTSRLVRAWRTLPHESRLAAFASIGLFLTLFLPWYQVTLIDTAKTSKLQSASVTLTGWGAFSFVEAAVLIIAAGVLTLLFQRAEGRAFHLPGGDGGVITAAGLWTCLLIVWRIFDKQGATTSGPSATTSGVEWGIFIALAAAAFLAYSGSRIRAAHRPEPPLPGEDTAPVGSNAAATTATYAPAPAASRRRSDSPSRSRQDRPPRSLSDRPARSRPDRPSRSGSDRPARSRPDRPSRSGSEAPTPTRSDTPATSWPEVPAPPHWDTSAPPRSRTPAPPRRRPQPSVPPVADHAADRPAPAPATAPEPAPATASEAATQPLPGRPRRRASAAELFERVVPDDPPTMPFGRAKRADIDETLRMRATPPRTDAAVEPPDEQATMRLGNDDDTLRLERN